MSICERTMISYIIQLCLYTIPTETVTLHVAFTFVNVPCHVNTQCTVWTTFACVYISVIDLSQGTVSESKGVTVS